MICYWLFYPNFRVPLYFEISLSHLKFWHFGSSPSYFTITQCHHSVMFIYKLSLLITSQLTWLIYLKTVHQNPTRKQFAWVIAYISSILLIYVCARTHTLLTFYYSLFHSTWLWEFVFSLNFIVKWKKLSKVTYNGSKILPFFVSFLGVIDSL